MEQNPKSMATDGETTTWLVDFGKPRQQDRARDDDQDDEETRDDEGRE